MSKPAQQSAYQIWTWTIPINLKHHISYLLIHIQAHLTITSAFTFSPTFGRYNKCSATFLFNLEVGFWGSVLCNGLSVQVKRPDKLSPYSKPVSKFWIPTYFSSVWTICIWWCGYYFTILGDIKYSRIPQWGIAGVEANQNGSIITNNP